MKSSGPRLIQIPVQNRPGSSVQKLQGTPIQALQGTSIAIAPVDNEIVQSVLVKSEPETDLTRKGGKETEEREKSGTEPFHFLHADID